MDADILSLSYLQMRNWSAKGDNGIKLIKSCAYVSEIVAFVFITYYANSNQQWAWGGGGLRLRLRL